MDYTKQPLGYNQIIQQLRSRGLLFHDETTAEEELKNLSYFRIANYLRSFEVVDSNHVFIPNSYFEDALQIYYFDIKIDHVDITGEEFDKRMDKYKTTLKV